MYKKERGGEGERSRDHLKDQVEVGYMRAKWQKNNADLRRMN